MPSDLTCAATTGQISGISESVKFLISTLSPAPVPPIHTATFRRVNFLPPSYRTAGSDIPILIE